MYCICYVYLYIFSAYFLHINAYNLRVVSCSGRYKYMCDISGLYRVSSVISNLLTFAQWIFLSVVILKGIQGKAYDYASTPLILQSST